MLFIFNFFKNQENDEQLSVSKIVLSLILNTSLFGLVAFYFRDNSLIFYTIGGISLFNSIVSVIALFKVMLYRD